MSDIDDATMAKSPFVKELFSARCFLSGSVSLIRILPFEIKSKQSPRSEFDNNLRVRQLQRPAAGDWTGGVATLPNDLEARRALNGPDVFPRLLRPVSSGKANLT